ncbi:MAG: hypothetical protein ACOY90_02740 [Candidatus Zhuqueibacterota bacterium]
MKTTKSKPRAGQKNIRPLPFDRENYIIFFIGVLVLILGYISLSQGPANSFWSLTLAPILLVFGYCFIIPISIIYRKRKPQNELSEKA